MLPSFFNFGTEDVEGYTASGNAEGGGEYRTKPVILRNALFCISCYTTLSGATRYATAGEIVSLGSVDCDGQFAAVDEYGKSAELGSRGKLNAANPRSHAFESGR